MSVKVEAQEERKKEEGMAVPSQVVGAVEREILLHTRVPFPGIVQPWESND